MQVLPTVRCWLARRVTRPISPSRAPRALAPYVREIGPLPGACCRRSDAVCASGPPRPPDSICVSRCCILGGSASSPAAAALDGVRAACTARCAPTADAHAARRVSLTVRGARCPARPASAARGSGRGYARYLRRWALEKTDATPLLQLLSGRRYGSCGKRAATWQRFESASNEARRLVQR